MDLLSNVIENLDLMYIISCNAATYFLIRFVESGMNANTSGKKKKSYKKLGTWWKRLISTLVAIAIGIVMYYKFEHPLEPLFYGGFVQFVTWDYLFKPIVKSLPQSLSQSSISTPMDGDLDA